MQEMQRLIIVLGLTTLKARAETFFRKHQMGQVDTDGVESDTKQQKNMVVDANGNVDVDEHLIASVRQQPLSFVRKHQTLTTGQIAANGSVAISNGLVNLTPQLSTWMMRKGQVAADSSPELEGKDATHESSSRTAVTSQKTSFSEKENALGKTDVEFETVLEEEMWGGTLVLNDGNQMPRLGYGLADGTDLMSAALKAGFRLFDTAEYYLPTNGEIGEFIRTSGVPRSEIFVASKAWPFDFKDTATSDKRSFPGIGASQFKTRFQKHLLDLGLEYLDLYMVHWPTDHLLEHWTVLQELRKKGLVRSIGVSNVNVTHLQALQATGMIPAVVQNELGPVHEDDRVQWNPEDLIFYCDAHGIELMSYRPLKNGLEEELVKTMAKRHSRSPAQILLRYALQRGFVPIFYSSSEDHITSALKSFEFELTEDDVKELACVRDGGNECKGRVVYKTYPASAPELDGSHGLLQFDGNGDAVVPMWANEPDPITYLEEASGRGLVAELRAAPRTTMPIPGMRPLGSVFNFLERHDHDGCDSRCGMGLRTLQSPRELWAPLAPKVKAALEGPGASREYEENGMRNGAQHIITVSGFDEDIAKIVTFLKPHLSKIAFNEGPVYLRENSVKISRNQMVGQERYRRTSMLWHVDDLQDTVKVLMYLSDVDSHNGCMIVLQHTRTGETVHVKEGAIAEYIYNSPAPSGLPRAWIAELLRGGYEPRCLNGSAGNMIIFYPNLIHRGARPAPGRHRDFILFEFTSKPEDAVGA